MLLAIVMNVICRSIKYSRETERWSVENNNKINDTFYIFTGRRTKQNYPREEFLLLSKVNTISFQGSLTSLQSSSNDKSKFNLIMDIVPCYVLQNKINVTSFYIVTAVDIQIFQLTVIVMMILVTIISRVLLSTKLFNSI
jgi:hypothetical protein